MQLSLFDVLSVPEKHLTRRDDPPTSKAGAKSVKFRAGTQMALLLQAYFNARFQCALTDDAAAEIAGLRMKAGCCWWHRCSDLRAKGLIESVGIADSPFTGEERMTCQITSAGISYAQLLKESK